MCFVYYKQRISVLPLLMDIWYIPVPFFQRQRSRDTNSSTLTITDIVWHWDYNTHCRTVYSWQRWTRQLGDKHSWRGNSHWHWVFWLRRRRVQNGWIHRGCQRHRLVCWQTTKHRCCRSQYRLVKVRLFARFLVINVLLTSYLFM